MNSSSSKTSKINFPCNNSIIKKIPWFVALWVAIFEQERKMADEISKNPKESSPKSGNYTSNWHHIINIKVLTIIMTIILQEMCCSFEI